VNFGCTPTKAALASALLAHDARRAGEFGLHFAGVEVHYTAVLAQARGIREESREGLQDAYGGRENPKILGGHARIRGHHEKGFWVGVGTEDFTAEKVVLDTGSRTYLPEVPGLDEVECIHAGNWLDRQDLPQRLVVLGGGVIALEMSQFYRRMGADVTVFEAGPRILSHEDEDVSSALVKQLQQEKIRFETNAKVEQLDVHADGLRVSWNGKVEEFDNIFVAAGRTPNTHDVGLDTVGVELDSKGFVQVNSHLETNVPGIYAVGDIRGGLQFTHTSWDDFRVMRSTLLGDGSKVTTGRVVPYAVFTDPELARVGLSEAEARQTGKNIKVGRFDMTHNGLARERRKRAGFVKVVLDGDTNRVLGAAILAADAAEMIHLLATMMVLDADYRIVRDAIVTHPSYMEAVQSALEAAR